MAKNIGIFCDGTWQHIDQPHPTNVANLARASMGTTPDGTPQVVHYDDGVGVSQGVLDAATHLVGGALGKGLDYKIGRAYEFIVLNYEKGDRLFLFGFSRGAYTARSLAGLMRWCGILKRDHAGRLYEAMALYRTRRDQPVGGGATTVPVQSDFEERAAKFRSDYCHSSEPFVAGKPFDPASPADLAPEKECTWIQYVGVWDTVGSLGIPKNVLFASAIDAQYRFYDPNLSRFVRSARHAVSIDERRKTFLPTLWDNIADLNANAGADRLAYDIRPYQQKWFPGPHGGVGGGGDDGGLSLGAMLWVAEGATRSGFAFDPDQIDHFESAADPCAKFTKSGFDLGEFVLELDGLTDRSGPQTFDEVSLATRLRWFGDKSYRPKPLINLPGIETDLIMWAPPAEKPRFFNP